jgi:hypothetical protein
MLNSQPPGAQTTRPSDNGRAKPKLNLTWGFLLLDPAGWPALPGGWWMCAVGRPTQKPHYPQLRPSAVPGRRRGTRHTTRCNDGHSHFTTCESNAHARWHVIWKTGRPPTAKGQSAQKQKPKGKGHPGTRAFLSRIAVLTPRTPNQPSGTASSHCLTPGYLFFRSAGCGLRAVGRLGRFVWVWGVGYYACACAINTCHAAFARFESNRKSEQSGRQSAIAKAKGAPAAPWRSLTPRPPTAFPPPPPHAAGPSTGPGVL